MYKQLDPTYYGNNDDGSEPHGYWLKSPNFERDQLRTLEAKRAVNEKRACWIHGPIGQNDAPNALPF